MRKEQCYGTGPGFELVFVSILNATRVLRSCPTPAYIRWPGRSVVRDEVEKSERSGASCLKVAEVVVLYNSGNKLGLNGKILVTLD